MEITVKVAGLDPLVEALHALATALRPSPAVLSNSAPRIAHEDRPDVGADVPLALVRPAAPALPAFAVGFVPPGAEVAAVPVPPLPAPFTAAVATSPTVPEVPTLGAPTPPAAVVPPALTLVPAAAVPSAPVAPTVPASAEATHDSLGMPWDARIHAGNRAMNKDGTWRQRRGTADTYVKEIEVQLRAAVAANAGAAPAVPAAPVAPAAPAAPTAPRAMLFAELAMKFQESLLSGKLTMEQLNASVVPHGLAQFNQLMHAPALVPAVDAALSALLGVAPGVPT